MHKRANNENISHKKPYISDNFELEVRYDSFAPYLGNDPQQIIFDEHQPEPEPIRFVHHHDIVEVGFCYFGNGVFFIDGENIPFTAPCVSIIYPGQVHLARSFGEQASSWLWISFQPESFMTSNLPWDMASVSGAISNTSNMIDLGNQLYEEWTAKEIGYLEIIRGLLSVILLRHSRSQSASDSPPRLHNLALHRRLQPIIEYIDQHYSDEFTLDTLAEQAFVHPATLRKWFVNATGQSPMQYLHRMRISIACTLLRGSDLPVSEIAMQVGYKSLSGFNRHFQSIRGKSPSNFRKEF